MLDPTLNTGQKRDIPSSNGPHCRFSSRADRSCLAMSLASTLEVGVVEGVRREVCDSDLVGVGGAFSTSVITESVGN